MKRLQSLGLCLPRMDGLPPGFTKLDSLTELTLDGHITDGVLKDLSAMKNLQKLTLDGIGYSDDALVRLMRALPELTLVKIRMYPETPKAFGAERTPAR